MDYTNFFVGLANNFEEKFEYNFKKARNLVSPSSTENSKCSRTLEKVMIFVLVGLQIHLLFMRKKLFPYFVSKKTSNEATLPYFLL